MLLKVLPEQVSKEWEAIWPAIQSTLPYEVPPAGVTKALEAFMSELLQCWFVVEGDEICAICTTTIFSDPCGRRSLLIYSLFGYKPMQTEKWRDAMGDLKKWASAKKCEDIIAYTQNPAIIRLVNQMGGDTSTAMVTIKVSGGE